VAVFEQHYLPGGFCTAWPRTVRRGSERLRYVFDAGVHDVSGLGPSGPVRGLLARLDLDDRLTWRRVGHEYVLPGLRVRVPEHVEDYVALLGRHFPGARAGISAFFAEMHAVYRELYADPGPGGVPGPPTTVDGMLAYPDAHPHVARWLDAPFSRMLTTYVGDAQARAVLSMLTGYLTDTPEALRVIDMAPIFGFYFDGGYYPVGSSQALANALVEATEKRGGRVSVRTPVRRILVERGRATGVELSDGRRAAADAVVANADVRRTFLELVGREHLPADFTRQIEALRPSASAFIVFLGTDIVPDAAPLTLVADEGGSLAVAVPSLLDPSLAPPGHSAVTLVSLMEPDLQGWDRHAVGYRARKRAAGDALIARAERLIPRLAEHIVYRQEGSPATFARYAWTSGGAIYGPVIGAWRPPARSPLPGLVLAGSGVFPGAGVEAAVISGTLAAEVLRPASIEASSSRAAAA
jgi:phytoene dehydrogenase-like protein